MAAAVRRAESDNAVYHTEYCRQLVAHIQESQAGARWIPRCSAAAGSGRRRCAGNVVEDDGLGGGAMVEECYHAMKWRLPQIRREGDDDIGDLPGSVR